MIISYNSFINFIPLIIFNQNKFLYRLKLIDRYFVNSPSFYLKLYNFIKLY